MPSTVSVIIPCFNASRFIRETIASIATQGYPALEVIVVDDHSMDGSAELIERTFPWVRVMQAVGQGVSAARNLGTELATGAFIQYLDADDLLAPEKLARQVSLLDRTGADVAYGDWQRLVPSGDRYVPGERVSRALTAPEIDLFTNGWSPLAAYLFRRSIVDRVGGWSENLPIIQDARFVLDCALRGGRFVRCEGLMAYYRTHAFGSVSTRDPLAFARDCFLNGTEIESWWRGHGGLDSRRVAALVWCYEYVARSTYERDRSTFNAAYQALQRVRPGYSPNSPRHLALASHLLGYPHAEWLALRYRRAKALARRFYPSGKVV